MVTKFATETHKSCSKNDTHNKKVKKLLTALRNALECGNAIVFMLKSDECNCLLLDEKTTQELVLQQDKWNCLLRTVIKEMEQKLHLIILYKGLSPVIRVRHLPNSFEISDMLKLTGYYSADYLPGCNQEKTLENVITYIKTLEGYIAKTFIVLVSTVYQGEWQYWGKRFSDLYMSIPYDIALNICSSSEQDAKRMDECSKNAQV